MTPERRNEIAYAILLAKTQKEAKFAEFKNTRRNAGNAIKQLAKQGFNTSADELVEFATILATDGFKLVLAEGTGKTN